MAYDAATDTLYVFNGKCCTSSVLPTAYRLKRGSDGKFHVESYQPLPSGSDFTASAVHPTDGKLYVGVNGTVRQYTYATNTLGSSFSISGVSGILGMSLLRRRRRPPGRGHGHAGSSAPTGRPRRSCRAGAST